MSGDSWSIAFAGRRRRPRGDDRGAGRPHEDPRRSVQAILAEAAAAQRVLPLGGGLYLHRETAVETARLILDSVAEFHRMSP